MGYQTFDKWIDESYDNEPERGRRSKMVVEQIKKFENYTIEELAQIRNEMKSVCEHNQKHYNKLYDEKYNEGINLDLERIIKDIWEELVEWK